MVRLPPCLVPCCYEDIEPSILIEEFINCEGAESCLDYRFFCFHGEPRLCQVDIDRFTSHRRNLYDTSWKFIPVEYNYDNGSHVPRPSNLASMLHVCRKLSQDFDFVRVDLYSTGGRMFFGELTHYPAAGFGVFNPPGFDLELGAYWNLAA